MEAVRAAASRGSAVPNILSIAGSDPSGGAGIQADIKSISANGGYALAVVTALTAQNTRGVTGVHTPPVDFLRQQLDAVAQDIVLDAVKIGMLGSADVARCIGSWLEQVRPAVVVLDPVMVATSGARLLDDDAVRAVLDLAARASLVTPNIPELAVLVGAEPAASWQEALQQGRELTDRLGTAVLVKGGHLPVPRCPDALILPPDGRGGSPDALVFDGRRVATTNTHGTGCSFSSAIATRRAVTGDWGAAVREAKAWLEQALASSDLLRVGQGSGPVHHFHGLPDARHHRLFTDLAWHDTADIRREILDLPFVTALTDGVLPAADFAFYLQQDALYLREYSGILARAAALAPTESEQLFWLRCATSCLETEAELHRSWLDVATGARSGEGGPGPVTRAYCDHLAATSARGSYAELVAAVLPCFWLYATVGDYVREHVLQEGSAEQAVHPYGAWIATYADPAFAAATAEARRIADRAHREGSSAERDAMLTAFRWSAAYERDFFDAPRARRGHAAPPQGADLREDAVLP
ncbi:bifunctional hydroxymethylpyrimidine kinase/phosphomethylpyrimidine kinase [Arthrobacter agilis]|uniref:bifunctional hydroxymethylpyrimidine kinase/phosphomethylpyrimidine kinase n=1 Tax=Arthrobacter agilis TaxID=37921 RepID=UPI0023666352|nr:bifunctional hydroxymethylpyrimidine kinase/phosphomethylpyrimidine kinase [Arthrobacter agilis]WDF34613.1 bifunctional hydroxymethylpyrimidine kinase/phosphomethylpyrimidine kinase [Arthrobacter agilis]